MSSTYIISIIPVVSDCLCESTIAGMCPVYCRLNWFFVSVTVYIDQLNVCFGVKTFLKASLLYDFYLLRNLFFNVFFNGVKLHHLLKAIKNNSDLQEGVRVCFLKSVLQSHIGACGAFRLSCFKSNLQMLRVTRKNLIIRNTNLVRRLACRTL